MTARRLLGITGGGSAFAVSGGGGGPSWPTNMFAMFNGQNGDGQYKIGQASSTDQGVTWTESGSNPVLSKSGAGWVSSHVKDPWLMADGLTAYVSGYNGTAYQIGRVTRPDTSSTAWAYDSTVTPNIAVGAGGSFDDAGCAFPTILYEPGDTGREYKMWYRADDGSVQRIAYAYSSDGLTWTKVGVVLDVGSGGTWDDVGIAPGAILKSGSTYHLFYSGRQNTTAPVEWQGGLATFTDPEGTYTKASGNPTLLAAFNTSGMSQNLTANTLTGSASVAVADTSHWADGWTMAIADGTSETEMHRITVNDATHVTLDAAVLSDFTTAAGANIRPGEENSVFPRTVFDGGAGSQLMFLAAFQPVDDLTVGGTKLREMSMRATASTLDSSWTIDHASGLLFPLYPATTGWHKFSAENPSVIAAP